MIYWIFHNCNKCCGVKTRWLFSLLFEFLWNMYHKWQSCYLPLKKHLRCWRHVWVCCLHCAALPRCSSFFSLSFSFCVYWPFANHLFKDATRSWQEFFSPNNIHFWVWEDLNVLWNLKRFGSDNAASTEWAWIIPGLSFLTWQKLRAHFLIAL